MTSAQVLRFSVQQNDSWMGKGVVAAWGKASTANENGQVTWSGERERERRVKRTEKHNMLGICFFSFYFCFSWRGMENEKAGYKGHLIKI